MPIQALISLPRSAFQRKLRAIEITVIRRRRRLYTRLRLFSGIRCHWNIFVTFTGILKNPALFFTLHHSAVHRSRSLNNITTFGSASVQNKLLPAMPYFRLNKRLYTPYKWRMRTPFRRTCFITLYTPTKLQWQRHGLQLFNEKRTLSSSAAATSVAATASQFQSHFERHLICIYRESCRVGRSVY